MKKVLAITVALLVAAIIFAPALGYTNKNAGSQSNTAKFGSYVDSAFKPGTYTIKTGVPGHNVTPEMVQGKYTFKSAGVESSKMAYSIIGESAKTPYSAKTEGVDNVNALGEPKKQTKALGEASAENVAPEVVTPKPEETVTEVTEVPEGNQTTEEAVPAEGNKTTETPEAAPEATVPVEKPNIAIDGVVFNDVDGNGAMDNNDAALANWTVNLEMPAGTIITSVQTDENGKFAFADLAAGEYTVTEVVQEGWTLGSPAEGKFVVSDNAANLMFANKQAA